jgi:hypothetical protein
MGSLVLGRKQNQENAAEAEAAAAAHDLPWDENCACRALDWSPQRGPVAGDGESINLVNGESDEKFLPLRFLVLLPQQRPPLGCRKQVPTVCQPGLEVGWVGSKTHYRHHLAAAST